jgi:hypothetical protein
MRFSTVRSIAMLPVIGALAILPSTLHAQTDYAAAKLADSGKVLVIVKENLKPGKDGAAHEKTEMEFARAMAASKSDDYYLGMTALSGEPRALFMSGYSSLADWEAKRSAMPAASGMMLDKINQADGEVLTSESTAVFLRNDELSTNTKAAPSGARYLEITYIVVKPGHEYEFEVAAKMYKDDMLKSTPGAHWTCYSSNYGQAEGGIYIFMTALKSLSEADTENMQFANFLKTTGPADLKKLDEARSHSVLTQMTNLFRYSPKMSYPPPGLVAADPFWKVKETAPKPAPKPVQ